MPYIKPELRKRYDKLIKEFKRTAISDPVASPGDANYIITRFLLEIINNHGRLTNYTDINALIGVLECCKLELYRRIAVPYEERKIKENGDVS